LWAYVQSKHQYELQDQSQYSKSHEHSSNLDNLLNAQWITEASENIVHLSNGITMKIKATQQIITNKV
jgi:hypothetical protein